MAQRIVKFLYNKTNRRMAAGALFTGLLLKNSLKHIFPEDLYFPFHAYSTEEPYVIEAIKMVNRCKYDMGMPHHSMKITPFVAASTEVCSAGFSAFNLGQCHIGVPASFFCNSVEELSHINILQRRFGKPFEKVDENEIKLMKSFLLTEDAQKFAVARHISYFQRNWALYESIVPSLFVVVGYLLVYNLPRSLFAMSSKPVSLAAIIITSLVGAFSAFILCKLTTAALSRKILNQADLDAAKVSPKYAKGGIEMYRKYMETGAALRVLFGRKGENMYTKEGNIRKGIIPLFSRTAPDFSERIKRLEQFSNP